MSELIDLIVANLDPLTFLDLIDADMEDLVWAFEEELSHYEAALRRAVE